MNWNSTDPKQIRKFGIVVFILFGILCGLGIWRNKSLPTYFFGLLAVLGIGFVIIPAQLRPVYSAWIKVTHFIGTLFTKLLFILAYYIVITPAAIIKRFAGGAPLPLKPDKEASTYWVPRAEPFQKEDRFFKRY